MSATVLATHPRPSFDKPQSRKPLRKGVERREAPGSWATPRGRMLPLARASGVARATARSACANRLLRARGASRRSTAVRANGCRPPPAGTAPAPPTGVTGRRPLRERDWLLVTEMVTDVKRVGHSFGDSPCVFQADVPILPCVLFCDQDAPERSLSFQRFKLRRQERPQICNRIILDALLTLNVEWKRSTVFGNQNCGLS